MNDEEVRLLLRRIERERRARKEAERIAEQKSRELYLKNRELERLAAGEARARVESDTLRRALADFTSTLDSAEITTRLGVLLAAVAPHEGGVIYLLEDENTLRVAGLLGRPAGGVALGDAGDPGAICALPSLPARLTLPMCAHGRRAGCVVLERRGAVAFAEDEVRLARGIADEAAVALESARLFAEVQRLATTDPLTGLLNRRAFTAAGTTELQRAGRHGRPVALVMMDLDHFKHVNDTHGHPTGDLVLATAAACCRRTLRATDVLARLGGEEFCFLLPETALVGGVVAAERLRRAIAEQTFSAADVRFSVTASFGVAERSAPRDTLEHMLKRSDAALYDAKRPGRDRVVGQGPRAPELAPAPRDGKSETS